MSLFTNLVIRYIAAIFLVVQIVSKQFELFKITSLFIRPTLIHISHLFLQAIGIIEIEKGFPTAFHDDVNRDLLSFSGYMTAIYCIALIFAGFFLLYTNKLVHLQIVSWQSIQVHCNVLKIQLSF